MLRVGRLVTQAPSDAAGASGLFAQLSPALRQRVMRAMISCSFKPRQALFRAGDPADALYFVVRGHVRVSRTTTDHVALLHSESAGGVLGEIPIFGGGAFPATAVATEPTDCLKLPMSSVQRLLQGEPEFARYALSRLAIRAQTLLRRIDELTASTITTRVAAYVLQRASDDPFTLGMSQTALADEIGTAREVVVRALAALVRAGALGRAGRSRFVVANWTLLRALAGRE